MTLQTIPVNDLGRLEEFDVADLLQDLETVLSSGQFLNGPRVGALENIIGETLLERPAVCVASGTDALYLALRALEINESDAVLTAGNAGGYGFGAISRCGAKVILADIDSETSQISVDEIERQLVLLPNIRAILVTHLYGLVSDIKRIAELCQLYGKYLVEDCAQSFGAMFNGRQAGSWGDAAAFSFYPTKNLAALGDGGLVALKDLEACSRARKIAQYGWSSRYEVELPDGINSRLDEMQAAVVLHRLKSVDSRNSRRRDILRRYAEAVTMPRRFIFEDSERCVAHLGVMRTPMRDRDRAVLNSFGIETTIHYPIPDHKQPAWRHLFEGVALPNTEAHCAEVLTLPCFPELTEEEIVRVCEALRSL